MNVKDVFLELLQESQKELDEEEREALQNYEDEKARFRAILPVLDDLRDTIDESFVRIEVDDDPPRICANIYVGNFASDSADLTLRQITPMDNADGEPVWYFQCTDEDAVLFDSFEDLVKHMLPRLSREIAELQKRAEQSRC